MPYLTTEAKSKLDAGTVPRTAGELTYLLARQVQKYLPEELRYEHMATVLGALEGCKSDFIDRILLPYEHRKWRDNGDVWNV